MTAAPSLWFEADDAKDEFVRDANGVIKGGVRMGLVELPVGYFKGASSANAVMGEMQLFDRETLLNNFSSLAQFQAACDEIGDQLEEAGYLEPNGRRLLHAVEAELWGRIIDGDPARGPRRKRLFS